LQELSLDQEQSIYKGIIKRYLKVCDDPICMMSSSCNSTHVSGGTVTSLSVRCTRVRRAKGKGCLASCLTVTVPQSRSSKLKGSTRGELGDPDRPTQNIKNEVFAVQRSFLRTEISELIVEETGPKHDCTILWCQTSMLGVEMTKFPSDCNQIQIVGLF